MLSMSPWFSKISSRVFSQRFSRFKASIIFGFTSKYLPEILLRENIWVKRGSIPGEVPATRPIFAFGAMAKSVAFRIPFFTFVRKVSQSNKGSNRADSFLTVSLRPRLVSRIFRVSTGTSPLLQPEPLKFL